MHKHWYYWVPATVVACGVMMGRADENPHSADGKAAGPAAALLETLKDKDPAFAFRLLSYLSKWAKGEPPCPPLSSC